MKALRRWLLAAPVLLVLVFLGSLPRAAAKPEASKRTLKKCDVCHVTRTSRKLNDVGSYYKKKNTLRGAPYPTYQPKKKGPSPYYRPR